MPDYLRQGIFTQAATYPVVIRISIAPGDILPNDISTARGVAMKVMNVDGERVPRSDDRVQDFVMINSIKFLTETLKALSIGIAGFAATTDKIEGMKKAASFVMQGAERMLEAVGLESINLKLSFSQGKRQTMNSRSSFAGI